MFYKIISFFTGIILAVMSFFGVGGGHMIKEDALAYFVGNSQAERIADGKLTGSHAVVFQNGEKILDETYGKASANGEALSPDAVYRIASMTKPITAVAMLMEYEKGNLDIYADVSDYLDGYDDMYVAEVKDGEITKGEKAKNSIKVYQLVSHTSGIGCGDIESLYSAAVNDNTTVQSIAEYFSDKPLLFNPGTSQSYSTCAYDIAARIIEITSGTEFGEYVKVNIFDKLGMTDTTFEPTAEQFARMVAVHARADGKNADAPVLSDRVFGSFPVTYHAAGAGLASTASDYSKFAEMLQNGGVSADGTRILSEASVKLMATPVSDPGNNAGNQKWGLGVRVITDNTYTLPKGTFGWSGAYGTHFWIDPVNKITAVYMKNSAYDGGAGASSSNEFEKDVMNSLSLKKLG